MNRTYLIITALLILIVISLVILSNLIRKSSNPIDESSNLTITAGPSVGQPTRVPLPNDFVKGQSIKIVPTLNPTEGLGLDLNSVEIKNSQNEINKIKNNLPYKKSFTSSSGIAVDINIPSAELQGNDWRLMVHILGPDYEISSESIEYEENKSAFSEAAIDVFYWLKDNDVKTEKIILRWGDKEFIQKRSEEWLK